MEFPAAQEVKHHPSSMDLELVKRLVVSTKRATLQQFLAKEFSCISNEYAGTPVFLQSQSAAGDSCYIRGSAMLLICLCHSHFIDSKMKPAHSCIMSDPQQLYICMAREANQRNAQRSGPEHEPGGAGQQANSAPAPAAA